MSVLLEIRHVQKSFGQRQLFDIDLLRIDAATAYVLTGTNGAGKSTLLRILCGLEPAQNAQYAFQGKVGSLSPYPSALRDAIVYVHQHPVMFSTTVAQNIGYGLSARGLSGSAMKAKVEEAMVWAGVAHLRDSPPLSLSGGEKQRIALARARVLEPKLLLLDEPTSNLDGAAREQVIGLIPTLIEAGSSVIMACHDRDLIGLPGVHRIKLRDGKLDYR